MSTLKKTELSPEVSLAMSEAFNRLLETGQPEMLTIDGQPKAVVLSPSAYELLRQGALVDVESVDFQATEEDIEAMKISLEQHRRGESKPVNEAFASIRQRVKEKLGR